MLNSDFREFAALLNDHGAEYLVVVGLNLHLIGLADAYANKRAPGRLKDLADLEALGERDPPG